LAQVSCRFPCENVHPLTYELSETAVVRGALITGLTRSNSALPYPRAAGRIASKSYGILRYENFDRNKGHDPRRM
jgi:hypothetical protein